MAVASSSGVRETERKYELPDGVDLTDPGVQLGLPIAESGAVELAAVYYDTSDLRLARIGITLRRREGGSDAGWHLKLPVGPDVRDEVRVPLGRSRTRPPSELVSLLRVHTRGVALTPVAQLHTSRRRWMVADKKGRGLAELVEDRVAGQRVGSGTGSEVWRELEVELVGDSPVGALDRIEQRLLDVGASRSQAPSKLARLVPVDPRRGDGAETDGAVGEIGAGPVTDSSSAGAVVMAYLRTQVEVLRAQDVRVRRGAPNAIHQLRVAARRARSILQAFGAILDRDATGDLIAELRWLGRVLAPARDSEVLLERFTTGVRELPSELVLGPVEAGLTRRFAPEHAHACADAMAALDSDRYLDLQVALDRLLESPPLRLKARKLGRRRLVRSVNKAVDRMHRRLRHAQRTAEPAERDRALHRARKAAKRARYATEARIPVFGKPARRLRKRVKKIQSIVGDHHDTVIARPVLRELAVNAHLDGGNGFTFGVLYGREAADAARLDQELSTVWTSRAARKTARHLTA